MRGSDSVLGYRRPAMLGGAASADRDALTIRWYGTSQPKAVLPCHHDDLYPVFIDLATEPLKMGAHEKVPESRTVQPVYVEPVTIGLKTGLITQRDG